VIIIGERNTNSPLFDLKLGLLFFLPVQECGPEDGRTSFPLPGKKCRISTVAPGRIYILDEVDSHAS
jgi:hypothetical protein